MLDGQLKKEMAFIWLCFIASVLVLAALASCTPNPPHIQPVKPPSIEPQIDIKECPPKTSSLVDNVCDGLFTPEGLACVRCFGGEGCYNKPEIVYCVTGACLEDAKCRYHPPDLPTK
jgi:hypothetical protein